MRSRRRLRDTPGSSAPAPAATGAPARSLQGELRSSARLLAVVLAVLLSSVAASTAYLLLHVGPALTSATETLRELRCVQTSMLDQETGLRAYVSTGDLAFLQPADAGVIAFQRCEPALLKVAGDDRQQFERLVGMLVAARTWQQQWAQEARATPPGSTRDDTTSFFLVGKGFFDTYRTQQDRALVRAGERRDDMVARQRHTFEFTGLLDVSLVLGVLVVDLRRRRRLQRVVDAPVRQLLDTMRRIDRGELGVQNPTCDIEEFWELGTGLFGLSRRLEREQAQGLLREEAATRLAARLQVVVNVARNAAGSPSPTAVAEMVAAAAVELGRLQAVVWLESEDAGFVPVRSTPATGPADPPSPAVLRAAVEARSVRVGDRACFPLVVAGRVVGVLDVVDEAWDDEDTAQVDSVLEALARFAAVALESARLHAQTLEQARSDSLTGLRNRRSLDTDLPVEWSRARRYDRPFSIALLDLDHFKRVNDTAGHAVGDAWLRLVGGVVLGRLRTSDSAYRYGGEELVVLLPETDADAAFIVADRLREAVEACQGPSTYPSMTVSIGVATATFGMADSSELLAAADAALYAAKAGGRNTVVVASPAVLAR
ncbi:diguanylate cyclase (GGDEF)-like protein [Motilibacter peucedani]|uniref:Diguanylate cyclase (GGDEF)-like protein n=1 Tax=Motilibacter peucedani TaxID=598650 RepID=A0A420XTT4_9ACTN|nr:GGDEF domain-containing protein [Motilibacter peucedani]RKS80245.1 diguanylate cyclase (GGDEF)-like protein [Motilibacter peucedani]